MNYDGDLVAEGFYQQRLGWATGAENLYRQAFKTGDMRGAIALANMLLMLNERLIEAIEWVNLAIRKGVLVVECKKIKALLLAAIGERTQAIIELEEILVDNPDDEEAAINSKLIAAGRISGWERIVGFV